MNKICEKSNTLTLSCIPSLTLLGVWMIISNIFHFIQSLKADGD